MTDSAKRQGPIRMCVICRSRFLKHELSRYICPHQGAEPVLDLEQTMQGRGFYLCGNQDCTSKLGTYKGWRRTRQGERNG